MSVSVALDALWEQVREFGDCAYLVTAAQGGEPHVVSVLPRVEGGSLRVGAGKTSRANAAARPVVSLLWPAAPGAEYSLIVDGTATELDDPGGALAVEPTRAVLHRVAGAPGDGPGCVRVLPGD